MAMELKFTHVSAIPIDVSWKLVQKGNELLTKASPAYFADVEVLEGDGGVGTVRIVTLGEGVGPEGAGQKVKERVDVMDEATHTLSYSVVEGGDPRYTGVHFTLQFAAASDSTTTIDWTVNYTPINNAIPPPKHMEVMAKGSMEAMEGYAKQHAAEFA